MVWRNLTVVTLDMFFSVHFYSFRFAKYSKPKISQSIEGLFYFLNVFATRVAALLYVNFLFLVFGFPLDSRLVFSLHIYICLSRTCEKN